MKQQQEQLSTWSLVGMEGMPTLGSAPRWGGLQGPAAGCPAVLIPAMLEQGFRRQGDAPGAPRVQGCKESLAVVHLLAGTIPSLLML